MRSKSVENRMMLHRATCGILSAKHPRVPTRRALWVPLVQIWRCAIKRHCLPLTLGAAVACSDGGSSHDTASGGTAATSGANGLPSAGATGVVTDGGIPGVPNSEPDFGVPAGVISVKTWLSLGETELTAVFADAPPLRFHRETGRTGQCRLMEPYAPSTCTPACTGSDACIDAECRTYPTRVDRGPIEWSWPGGHKTVSATDIDGYHGIGEAHEPGEVVVQVDGLTLRAPGDHEPAADADWDVAVTTRASGADVTLRWINPSPGARIRVHMTDCTGSHGGLAAAEIECEGPDTGAIVLPGAFLDRLAAGDWSHGECGSHRFERYYIDTPAGDDTFRLETIARANFFYRGP